MVTKLIGFDDVTKRRKLVDPASVGGGGGGGGGLPLTGGTLTGLLTLATSSATVAPLKFVSGTLLTTPVAGVVEYDGTNLLATNSANVRKTLAFTDSDITGNAANVTGTVALANGGTGATTAAATRTNLGLVIGTNVQAYNANLGTIAGLTQVNGNFLASDGTNWMSRAIAAGDISSGTLAIARIPTGSTASTVAIGNDSRFGDASKIQGVSVPAPSGTNTVLSYNGSALSWGAVSGGGSGLPTTGGSMTGTIGLVANSATVQPLRFVSGPLLTTPASGSMEFDGTLLYLTNNTPTRKTVAFIDSNITGNAANITGTAAVANGGTGATTAAGARTNLGLVIGTDVQAFLNYTPANKAGDTFTGQLVLPTGTTTLAPLRFQSGVNLTTPVAGSVEFDGTSLFVTNSTPARKTLAYTDSNITGTAANVTGTVALANGGTGATAAAGARTNLGLVVGTDVQAFNSNLGAIAALAQASGNAIISNGTAWTARAIVAGDITSGTFAIGQIPTGSTASTVAIGNDTRFGNATKIQGINVPAPSTANTFLNYDGTSLFWTAASGGGSGLPTTGGTMTGAINLVANSTTVAPLKFSSGSLLTTPVAGSMEYDGTGLYVTNGAAARKTVAFTDSNITGNAVNVTGTVAVANGGTGATAAAGARTNLGLVIGTDVQANLGFVPVNKAGDTTTGRLTLVAGTTTVPPLRFQLGANVTTVQPGAMEYDGTSLFLTDNFSNRKTIAYSDSNISGFAANVSGTVAVSNGGTGATTASAARSSLGLVIGTDVQAFLGFTPVNKAGDSMTGQLTLPAGTATVAPLRLQTGVNLTTAAAGAVEFDGTNLFLTNGSAVRKTLAYADSNITGTAANITGVAAIANGGTGASTAATARTNLGLVIGTDVQAFNSNLSTIAGLTQASGSAIVSNGTAWTARAIVAGDITSGTFGIGQIPTGSTASTVAIGNDARFGNATSIQSISVPAPSGTNTVLTYSGSALSWAAGGGGGGLPTTGGTMTGAINLVANSTTVQPLRFTSGSLLSTPASGSMEFDGTSLYLTNNTPLRKTVAFTDSTITGNAANVTGTVAVANGGTGATTAVNALASLGAFPTAGGSFLGPVTLVAGTAANASLIMPVGINLTTPLSGALEFNGTNLFITTNVPARKTLAYLDSTITGNAANVTGTVAVANGGTGATTAPAALTALGGLASAGGAMTGQLVLPVGTTTLAPLRFQTGVNLTTAVAGSVEFDGTSLFVTNSAVARKTIAYIDSALPAPGVIGGTTPNAVTATTLRATGAWTRTPVTAQALTGAASVTVAGASVIPITSTANVIMAANPQIVAGGNGQQITLVNTGTFAITFVNGLGIDMGRSATLLPGMTLDLVYSTLRSAWVDASYNIATSNRPSFSALRTTTSQTGLTSGAWTGLIYNTVSRDIDAIYNSTTGIATIPSWGAGTYLISAGGSLDNVASILNLALFVGGVDRRYFQDIRTSGDSLFFASGSLQYDFVAGDTFNIRMLQINAGAVARSFAPGANGQSCYLNVCRLNV
jgi:hypothetical protein